MTDAEYEAEKARVGGLFQKWVAALGLNWWQIEIEYVRENATPGSGVIQDASFQATFKVRAAWQYARASITAYLPAIEDMEGHDLEMSVVHELCHIFLNETRDPDTERSDWLDHEERVATTLAKAFIWLRDSVIEEKDA